MEREYIHFRARPHTITQHMIHPAPQTSAPLDDNDVAKRAVTRIQARYRGAQVRGTPITLLAAQARARSEQSDSQPATAALKTIALSLSKLVAYLLLGVVVYGFWEPTFGQTGNATTTVVDSVFFSVATMSTVGYGDLVPTSVGSRVFTLFMIYGGIIFVFADICSVFGLFTTPLTAAGRRQMERLFPQVGVDLSGDGKFDYYQPRPPLIYYTKNLLPSLLLTMGLQLVSAAIFCLVEPGWTFFDAFYHCMVTASTVGYGDQTIATQEGRAFASFHMLASVVLIGELIGTADELRVARADTLKRISYLQKELDEQMLLSLLNRAIKLRPMVERDGKGLTELEFVVTILIELGIVEDEVMKPFIKQFRTLDIDGEGRVGLDDLRVIKKLTPAQLAAVRAERAKTRRVSIAGATPPASPEVVRVPGAAGGPTVPHSPAPNVASTRASPALATAAATPSAPATPGAAQGQRDESGGDAWALLDDALDDVQSDPEHLKA